MSNPERKQVKSETPEEILARKIHLLLGKLEKRATEGSQKAKEELNFIRWLCLDKLKANLERSAKAGEIGFPPPIRTLLEMADFAIPLLLWLSKHQRDNVKQYARNRWAWPAYVHLSKQTQNLYEALLPKFNSTGKQIVKDSPIGLGSNLGLVINPSRTKGDWLFVLAANTIRWVADIEESRKVYFGRPWNWLSAHHKPLAKTKSKNFDKAARKFLESHGKFTRANWNQWKPVFETYLTLHYGPPSEKFKLFPPQWKSNLFIAAHHGAEMQWFEEYRKSRLLSAVEETQFLSELKGLAAFHEADAPLQQSDRPEIREIVNRRKTEKGKWIELKDELLKRIFKLAPPS